MKLQLKLKPASWPWLLRHELRLTWRGFDGARLWFMLALGGAVWLAVHAAAYALLVSAKIVALPPQITLLFGMILWLVMSLMLSQAIMLSVNALFDRGDLDLLLSSPLSARTVLTVRGLGIAVGVIAFYFLFITPFAHVGVLMGQFRLAAIYPALLSIGLCVTSLGMLATLTLVRFLGARRARVAAQLLGALIGAIFFLGSQIQSILPRARRTELANWFKQNMQADGVLGPDSVLWLPFRAMLGETVPLVIVVIVGLGTFALVMQLTYKRFLSGTQESVTGSAAQRGTPIAADQRSRYFRASLLRNVLVKEWRLIFRDPSLIAQTLLQVLYMMPLVFVVFRDGIDTAYVMPGVVLIAGSLAGSLAWLTVAAEDAPELIGSAPVSVPHIRRLKALAAVMPVWLLVSPMLVFLIVNRPLHALVFVICIAGCTLSAGLLQVWYPRKANRKDMKTRSKSELLATLMETMSAMGWSGLALALISSWQWAWVLVPVCVVVALAGPAMAWLMGRERRGQGMLLV